MIKAVIFDMDGVILDTEKLYVRFWSEAGRACGYPMEPRHALAIRSLARPYAIEKLRGFFGENFDYDLVRNKRIELMDAYVREHGVEAKPSAAETLSWLNENGYGVALATATPAARAKEYLGSLGLLEYFDKIVSAREVPRGKPMPDIYLKASSELGFSPSECMAVEDSLNGIRSASSAGCLTVMAVDLDEPSDEAKALVHSCVRNLRELIPLMKSV